MKSIHYVIGLGLVAGWLLGHSGLISSSIVHAAVVSAKQTQVEALVNINKASAEELQMVKGVGPMIAERIIHYREEFGPFKNIEELAEVKGIGSAKLDKIKAQVIV